MNNLKKGVLTIDDLEGKGRLFYLMTTIIKPPFMTLKKPGCGTFQNR
ncbi:hypothetical protein [Pseudobacillus badius]|nr:hypothetical protein [Bacillus badius]TDV98360.1 hypothetical protein B0G66_1273 [Bacillus badius]